VNSSPKSRSGSANNTAGTGLDRRKRAGESGYAYLMALFLVLGLMITSQAILRNLITERISQREQEMIWRGQQYARAIKVYYRKTGHYPQRQDELVNGVPGMHFLRSEIMKDPMNKDGDGQWRFIYTNAAGAIIGSVKYGSMQQMAMMDMNGGAMPGTPQPGDASADANSAATDSTQTPPGAPGTAPGVTQQNTPTGTGFGLGLGPPLGATPGATGATTAAPGTTLGPGQVMGPLGQPATPMGSMTPTGPVDGPVVGGLLVGVGSTVDKKSVRVYKGGKKYNEWEFIWNPIEEQAQAIQQGGGQQPVGIGAGLGLGGLPLGPTGALTPGQNGVSPGGAIVTPGGDNGSGGNQNQTNPPAPAPAPINP
jgi:hypothetical protein